MVRNREGRGHRQKSIVVILVRISGHIFEMEFEAVITFMEVLVNNSPSIMSILNLIKKTALYVSQHSTLHSLSLMNSNQ